MKAKYINPFTDFGFKKIFGEEASKHLLMDFLNALLPPENKIASLSFKNTEQLGQTDADRKAIFDIYCEAESGEKFIVELQKAKQNYFKDRTVYYSTFPIREQADKGEWNYKLKPVFCIGVLDFTFDDYGDDKAEQNKIIHTIKLKDQDGKIFYDKLTYIYIEMPKFTKQEHELETRLDQWLYFIRHLEDFQSIPVIFKDTVFVEAFATAELATLNADQWTTYEHSLKVYRDLKGVVDTAFDEGKIEGKAEGLAEGVELGKAEGERKAKEETARSFHKMGLSIAVIATGTGLTEAEIQTFLF